MTSKSRADRHNNPAAFTISIAQQARLALGVDFEKGDAFIVGNQTYYTARLLGDPIETTIRVIDTLGFFSQSGTPRWIYIGVPKELWDTLNHDQKKLTIKFMYSHEGGTEMAKLFAPKPRALGIEIQEQMNFGDQVK